MRRDSERMTEHRAVEVDLRAAVVDGGAGRAFRSRRAMSSVAAATMAWTPPRGRARPTGCANGPLSGTSLTKGSARKSSTLPIPQAKLSAGPRTDKLDPRLSSEGGSADGPNSVRSRTAPVW
jgi:hypothetical protein